MTPLPAPADDRIRPGAAVTVRGRAVRSRIAAIVLWGNLVCQIGIIVTGGVVRLTGSGLGCSTWPECEPGKFTPELTLEAGIHPFIEFGNRTLTGVLTVFAVALLVVTVLWLRHKGRGFLILAVVPFIGTIIQALIGMVVVFADLHPGVVSPHFLISPLLVAVSTVLVYRFYEGGGPRRPVVPSPLRWLLRGIAVLGFGVLVLGTIVTGTGPHSGDADDPARLPFDPRTVSWLHADAVMLFCGLLVGLIIALHLVRTTRAAKRAGWGLVAVTGIQAAIGYTQYFTGLPEVLVGLHLLGAGLFAAAIAWVGASQYAWSAAAVTGSAHDGLPAPSTHPHEATESTGAVTEEAR